MADQISDAILDAMIKDDPGSRVAVETLITTGQYDEVTMDCHETIHHAIKGSKLEVFKDCSHMTMSEKPAEYVAALRTFIA